MRKNLSLIYSIWLCLLFAGSGVAEGEDHGVVPNFRAVSALSDPAKLAALKPGNRAANQRFRRLMYFVHVAAEAGIPPKECLRKLYAFYEEKPYAKASHVFAPATECENLEAQYRLGKVYGLFTSENLELLKRGRAPVIVGEIGRETRPRSITS